MVQTAPLIQFEQVSKYYGACKANDGLNFSIESGTIHAIIGENGAGKSTAMKLLFGMEKSTSGTIFMRGQPVDFGSPRDAMAKGIGMVHQHFMLSPVHTALDNVILGCAPDSSAWTKLLPAILRPLPRASVLKQIEILAKEVDFKIPWLSPVAELSVGIQQQIEIMKLLYAGVDIMIFDEPTAVLSPQEIDSFVTMLRRLRSQGKTIIVITHKLREVKDIADTVTVMRQGRTVATKRMDDVSIQDLADLMVGRTVHLQVSEPPPVIHGPCVLTLKSLTLAKNGKALLSDLNLDVRAGEIIGVAGVEGNGQSDLLHLLYDPYPKTHGRYRLSGTLQMLGQNSARWSSSDVRNQRIGVVAADRLREAVLLGESLAENNLLGYLREFTKWGILARQKLHVETKRLIASFDVRPNDANALMRSLSGGNQQKFVMARELSRSPSLLLCAQPTRGVDVGSIEQIHREIVEARTKGMGILLVSSQLDELMQLSDRMIVMFDGRIVAEFKRGEFDERKIGLAMCGGGGRT